MDWAGPHRGTHERRPEQSRHRVLRLFNILPLAMQRGVDYSGHLPASTTNHGGRTAP